VNIVDRSEPVARHLSDILAVIDRADLAAGAKAVAGRIFTLLGEAEATVHGIEVEKVHFHEVGAIDSIMDVVGTAVLLAELDYSAVVATSICTGSGFVDCAHGKLPVPAPATELLLHGLPTFPGDIAAEMTTPTGAAIVKALEPEFSPVGLKITASGYGAGDREFEQPNCLRVSLGERVATTGPGAEEIVVIQTNLDDTSGELLGRHFQELLMAGGALDLSVSALLMKKGRPGHRLEVLCREADLANLSQIILNETSTIGLRYWRAGRIVLSRTRETVATRYGEVRLKCVQLPSGRVRKTPEYEDCRRMAIESGASVQEVMAEAIRLAGADP
jgi:uncharacterized protein (TIGR00299 family) protein